MDDLTQEQRDTQDFAVSIFRLKLGGKDATGHYMDLSCGGGNDWWFYREWEDGFDCYPVSEWDMRGAEYPVLVV